MLINQRLMVYTNLGAMLDCKQSQKQSWTTTDMLQGDQSSMVTMPLLSSQSGHPCALMTTYQLKNCTREFLRSKPKKRSLENLCKACKDRPHDFPMIFMDALMPNYFPWNFPLALPSLHFGVSDGLATVLHSAAATVVNDTTFLSTDLVFQWTYPTNFGQKLWTSICWMF